jgi:hypothetical protein
LSRTLQSAHPYLVVHCTCRKVAGLLSVVCGRLRLLHAAALSLHASFGASLGAQHAAIAESKLRSGQRRRPTGTPPDAAHQAAMGRVRAALRSDAFDDAQLQRLLADILAGQSPADLLQCLEVTHFCLSRSSITVSLTSCCCSQL